MMIAVMHLWRLLWYDKRVFLGTANKKLNNWGRVFLCDCPMRVYILFGGIFGVRKRFYALITKIFDLV
jgi:hypothetical protein